MQKYTGTYKKNDIFHFFIAQHWRHRGTLIFKLGLNFDFNFILKNYDFHFFYEK